MYGPKVRKSEMSLSVRIEYSRMEIDRKSEKSPLPAYRERSPSIAAATRTASAAAIASSAFVISHQFHASLQYFFTLNV